MADVWQRAKTALEAAPQGWQFWIKWYEAALNGRPLPCALLVEIAKIDAEEWEKEPAHINGLIAGIEEAYLGRATVRAERMELNPETGRLRVVPERMSQKALYSNVLETVADGMDDLKQRDDFDNALSALSSVFENILDRTFAKYLESPQRVHDDFIKARNRIQRLLDVGELSPEDEVLEFVSDLDKGAAHIRANMPQVRESMAALARLRISEASEDDLEKLEAGVEALAEESDPDLARELKDDVAEVLSAVKEIPKGAPPVQAPDTAARLANRTVEGKRILSKRNMVKVGTGVATGMGAGYALAQPIIDAVQIFLKLFGF